MAGILTVLHQIMPHALITGATGFVGSHLANRLMRDGWKVRALVRDAARLPTHTADMLEIVTGDLSNSAAVATAVRDVDIVFHCAANVATWASEADYNEVNVLGAERLLTAIIQNNRSVKRIVHLSTVDVYGFPETPADEQSSLGCEQFGYGRSKLEGETSLTRRAHNEGIPLTVIRPCNIFGPRSQFIERIGNALSSGIMLTIDGGKQHAGLLSVDNLIDCMLWAANTDVSRGQIYNLRDPAEMTWADFISLFRAEIKGKGVVVNLPFSVANSIAHALSFISKTFMPNVEPLLHPLIVRIFGRTCGHSIEKIRAHGAPIGRQGTLHALKQAIRWYREHHA